MNTGWAGIIPFAVSAAVSAMAAALAFSRRRKVPAALAFATIPLSHAVWTALNVAELRAPTAGAKLVLDALQWIPGLGVAVGSLWFACIFSGAFGGQTPRRATWVLLLAIPLPALIVEIAAPRRVHPGAYIRYDLPVPTLDYRFSWLDWALMTYGFLLIAAASALLARRVVQEHVGQLRQTLFVFVGLTLTPLAAIIAVAFQVRVLGQQDPTPLIFGVADLIVAYGLFRNRLFDLTPLARDALVAGLTDGIVVCDHAGRIIDANPALRDRLGIGPYTAIGQPAALTFARWPALVDTCTGVCARCELELTEGGSTRWLDVNASELRDRRGHDLGRAIVIRDVTDRQRAQRALARETERALRDSQQRFRAIIDHTFELIGLLDGRGNLLVANRTALDFAGLDEAGEAAILGQPFWDTPWWAHSEELRKRLRAAVAAAARGNFVRFEATNLHHDGEPRSIDFSLKAVRRETGNGHPVAGDGTDAAAGHEAMDDTGDVVLLIAEGRDVTELRRAERENAALEERLHRARRLEVIGRLAGAVAHDFNNLITAILGSLEVARQTPPDAAETTSALDVIEHAAQSAAQLTQRLLAFGRRQTHVPELVDPAAYFDGVRPLLARVLGDGVALTMRAQPGIWPLRLDVAQLEQVFLNLAANARDAMPLGGQLTIAAENVVREPPDAPLPAPPPAGDAFSAAATTAYVQLRFLDTGTGMDSSILERIFEPFYTTKGLGKGTGLGLAVVYGIVRQSGGYIEASSTPGQGSELRLLLPRAENPGAIMAGAADAR